MMRESKKREKEFDGIADKFRFGRNMNDATMLATARAFITEAGPYAADFKNYGLSGSFIADLTAAASDAFEASFSNTAAATADHVAATADTSAKIREGMIAKRILDGVVQNKYNNDPGKPAAWLSASHTEKAPKKKVPTP